MAVQPYSAPGQTSLPTPVNNGGASFLHSVGQAAGHVLNALPGYSTLGANITNPNINYSGAQNPGTPFNNYYNGSSLSSPDYLAPLSTSGSVQGASTTVDPYAQYGGQSAYNNLVSGFNTQKENIYGSANDAAAQAGIGLGRNVTDTLHGLTLGQQAIDQQAVQNDLAKQQGIQGILGMVGRGIRSGGVQLANKNATDSSAAQAIAQAYGDIGRRQASQVGNQYELGQNDIATKQQEQNYQAGQAPSKFHESLIQSVNTIVSDARNQFAQLDARMAQASLPDRLAIEQEKENVRNQVLGQLQQYDQQLQSGVQGISAATSDQNRAQANQLANAGQAAAQPFDFSTQVPGQFQNTGPFASELPIFTFPSNRKQIA